MLKIMSLIYIQNAVAPVKLHCSLDPSGS